MKTSRIVVGALYIAMMLLLVGCLAPRHLKDPELAMSFDFDTQPDLAFWNATGKADLEACSVGGGFMEQRTFDVNASAGFAYPNSTVTGGDLDPSKATILEARIDVRRIVGSGGVYFQAFDGACRYSVFLTPTGIDILSTSGVDHVSLDVYGFHTYRLETPGNSSKIRLYYDGELVLVTTAPTYTALNGFDFGDGITAPGNGGDVTWDYVRFCQRRSERCSKCPLPWKPAASGRANSG